MCIYIYTYNQNSCQSHFKAGIACFRTESCKEMLAVSSHHSCGVSNKTGAIVFLPCSYKNAVAHVLLVPLELDCLSVLKALIGAF